MGILIDSSVLIAEEDFAISAITASELLHGVHRAGSPAQRRRREAFVEGLLARFPVISFDAVAARIHARLSAELAANGTAAGPHDLIIAATALTKGRAQLSENSGVVVSTLVTGFCKKQVRHRLMARQRLVAGLRHRRQQKDLSQLDLPAKLESSQSWVAKMEAGARRFPWTF